MHHGERAVEAQVDGGVPRRAQARAEGHERRLVRGSLGAVREAIAVGVRRVRRGVHHWRSRVRVVRRVVCRAEGARGLGMLPERSGLVVTATDVPPYGSARGLQEIGLRHVHARTSCCAIWRLRVTAVRRVLNAGKLLRRVERRGWIAVSVVRLRMLHELVVRRRLSECNCIRMRLMLNARGLGKLATLSVINRLLDSVLV